jgi:thiol-disulfide isomerase/thioredoxin
MLDAPETGGNTMKRWAMAAILASVLCAGCGEDAAPPGEDGEPGINGQPGANGQPATNEGRPSPTGDSATGGAAPDDGGSGPILRAPDNAPEGDPPAGNGAAASADGTAADAVHVLNWDETLDLVKQHEGKVVIVDLWSHNCTPCLRELPHFAELCRKYPEQVTGIAFNMDYTGNKKNPPESFQDDVAETLGKYEADWIGVVCTVPDTDVWDQLGLNSVPAVFVFDQSGQQVKRFNAESEFTYEKDVAPLVESLLNEPAAE